MLELQGENEFRVRAYRNAGNTIENLSQNVADMVKKKEDLTELPGIGKDLADKIKSIVETGELQLLKALEEKLPLNLTQIMNISGLGAKKVKKIYDALNIKSIDVTHGFSLPDFSINSRLNPGQTTTVEFTADKTGTFTFFCSVQCGEGHSNMKGTLIVNG